MERKKGKANDPSNTRRERQRARNLCVPGRGGSRDGEEADRRQEPGPVGLATAREADGPGPRHPHRTEGKTDDGEAHGRGCAPQARRESGAEACRSEAHSHGAGDAGDHAPSADQPDVSIHGTDAAGTLLGEPRVDRAR